MYQVFISGYRLAEVSHGKPYYVYCIEVLETKSGTRYFVKKRYSEFSALHRTLKKENAEVAPFPPKRVRNCQPKVLEQRRAALELYTQKMLRLSATKQQVLNFLGIESRTVTASHKSTYKVPEDTQYDQPNVLGHHPVLTFRCDPYAQSNSSSSLPDIVINGVLQVFTVSQPNKEKITFRTMCPLQPVSKSPDEGSEYELKENVASAEHMYDRDEMRHVTGPRRKRAK